MSSLTLNGTSAIALIEQSLKSLRAQRAIADVPLTTELTPETRIDAIAVDSLGLLSLALELERRTGRQLAPDALTRVQTVGDVCVLLAPASVASPERSSDRQTSEAVNSLEATFSDYQSQRSPDLFQRAHDFRSFLDDFSARGHDRYLRPVLEQHGARAVVDGGRGFGRREVIRFCTADYLGMARQIEVVEASSRAVARHGASGCSVPLIAGMTDLNRELEVRLSELVGTDATVLYPTGHAANAGAIPALCAQNDLVVADKQVHYSILEGVRLSGASWCSFRHNDVEHLDEVLTSAQRERSDRGILVIVEGVYGIDGDVCPLPEVVETAHAHGARVMIDDAHALGVLGDSGGGTAEHYQMKTRPDLIMGSLSKSLGSFGGFISTNVDVADYLRYFSKTIAFSVGLPAPCIAAALAGVDSLRRSHAARERLDANIERFKTGLIELGADGPERSSSAIFSLIIGDEPKLRAIVRDLFEEGVWAEALPFPAVARGEERLRFRMTASHTDEDIDESLHAIGAVLGEHGLLSHSRSGAEARRETIAARHSQEVADLAATATAISGRRQPFLSSRLYRKVIAGESPWRFSSARRVLTRRDDVGLKACLEARLETVSIDREPTPVGLIGHIHWRNGCRRDVANLVDEAAGWLCRSAATTVLGPVQHPGFVLGSGVMTRRGAEVPFLEPEVDPALAELLRRCGFAPWRERDYVLLDLDQLPGPRTGSADVTTRRVRRTNLRREMEAITPVLDATIARLDACAPLLPHQLYGIAGEFRELMFEDLWRVAEVDGTVVGFAGGFPNLGASVQAAAGQASVADIEAIRTEIDTARTGFVAWLGVAPEHAGRGIAQQLLAEVGEAMHARGFERTLLSWEVVDGDLRQRDLVPAELPDDAVTSYQILARG